MPIDRTRWMPYEAGPQSSVVGTVLRSDQLELRRLGRSTSLWAWVPDQVDPAGFPVVYMHDGDNLFDAATSNAGEWQVDEAMAARNDAVIVGIPNAGERRMHEYCPWPNQFTDEVAGHAYVEDLVDTVVPFVEATLPVRRDRVDRGTMGSSLGGLISLYAFLERPEWFGFVGSMSTAAWWTPEIWPYLAAVDVPDGRLYVDVGTEEMPGDPVMSEAYLDSFHRLRRWARVSLPAGQVMAIEEEGAIHHESAWARRLPTALDFLLPPRPGP